MQQPSEKTGKLLLATEEELFNRIIDEKHPFRRLQCIIDFPTLIDPLRALYSTLGQTGVDIEKGFKSLLIQFWEDYSDREMEKAVRENMAIRWFCGFGLMETTPDHTYFCKLRKRVGTQRIADIFGAVNATLEQKGLFGNVFAFIDASSIISKTALWEERDRAIADGAEKLNNANVSQYAADADARWGAKSKTNIWFGYKRLQATDMRYGLTRKVAVTAANLLDYQEMDEVCPENMMVFCDKLFDCKNARMELNLRRCHAGIVRKNNNKEKNRDLDRWLSSVRMPFEGSFSKLRKRAKFRGKAKVLFQCIAEAICHNLKKAVTILTVQPIPC